MNALQMIARVWRHAEWADAAAMTPPAAAVREYARMIGAEEVWLARVDRRASRVSDESFARSSRTGTR